ncbi:MAG: ATP-binding cassette domain-containing protein [Propionibacteriaceae bacterium]|nr:ATP-binding cassette domain-containing protein [Propionibacteriaceae bacterium]
MICVENLTVSYVTDDEVLAPVLTGIDLHVAPGEIVLITGASGCGKTTLLRCINGLVPGFHDSRVSGRVLVDGMVVAEQETRDIARCIGMVFQDPRSEFFTFDVTSELAFCCENFQVPMPEIASRIVEAAERVGIGDLLDRRISTLSSGEKQKVAIATTMTNRPAVLLFDEPSANLDTEGLAMLTRVIAHLKGAGITVIVADHRLSYLAEVMDRCVVLERGRIVDDLTAAELQDRPDMWFRDRGLRDLVVNGLIVGAKLPTSSDALVRIANTGFSYPFGPNVWNIDDLGLPAGRIIGLSGANGSGKTTLLKLLVGLLRARGEKVSLNGYRWTSRARRRDCALVTQDVDYQLMGESILGEMLIGSRGERDEERARELLERFGLLDFAQRHPLTLSGGQKQRLAIALACMKDAKVICLDEPTSGLDAHNMRLVAAALRSLAEEGALIIVTTHDEAFASLCFDSMITITDRSVRHHELERHV